MKEKSGGNMFDEKVREIHEKSVKVSEKRN